MSIKQTSTGDVRDIIAFHSMVRNLHDDTSFDNWIAKLWAFDPGLTIRWMRLHADEFPNNRQAYNAMLSRHGKSRHAI